jgi:hypothetical protein
MLSTVRRNPSRAVHFGFIFNGHRNRTYGQIMIRWPFPAVGVMCRSGIGGGAEG